MRLGRRSFPCLATWAWAAPARPKKTARRDNKALGRLKRGLGIIRVHLLWTYDGHLGGMERRGRRTVPRDTPGRETNHTFCPAACYPESALERFPEARRAPRDSTIST